MEEEMARRYGTTKWRNDMTPAETEWFAACPKAVLFEIAKSFAMLQSEGDEAKAFALLQSEWTTLHTNKIVPQKPYKAADPVIKIAKEAKAAEKFAKQKLFWAKQVLGHPDREAIFTRQYGMTPQEALAEAKTED